ncbi:MAG TPA: reverse transcriptase domain-containing protein [Xanthobacteraceae bacterium]
MSDPVESATNCKPGTGGKPPRHHGKRLANDHARTMLTASYPTAAWPEFVDSAESAPARAHLRAKLTRIRKAHKAGDRKQLRYLIQQYLTSFDALMTATRLARQNMRWYRRPKKNELKYIAENLNAYQGTREEVRLILIPKGQGKFRPTLDFGIENRALQYLIKSILYAVADLHPRQFATRGGVPAAITEVATAIKAGNLHAREIDITDFYPSFDGNKLVDLIPVPKKVVERVLLSEHLNIVPSESLHHTATHASNGAADTHPGGGFPLEQYLADARRGIPQGSSVSPIVAEMLLAPVLHQVPAGGEVVAYADNISVIAKNDGDADSMTESLGIALQTHPAGQLWPKIKSFPPGGPIECLGHRLTTDHGGLRIQPTAANREEFESRMNRGLARLKASSLSPATRAEIVRELKSDLSSHASNFRLCDGMENCRQHWSVRIASASHGGSIMPQSQQSPTRRMVFWLHPDQEDIVTLALNHVKETAPTKFEAVALEYICQNYLGAGIQFQNSKQALAYECKKAHDSSTFAQKVLAFIQELCPGLVIEATITARSATHEQRILDRNSRPVL